MSAPFSIEDILRDAGLAGADHLTFALPRFTRPVHVVRVSPSESRSTWKRLRLQFESTKYWPLIVTYITNGPPGAWSDVVQSETDDLFSRTPFSEDVSQALPGMLSDDPAKIIAASGSVDPASILLEYRRRYAFEPLENAEWICDFLESKYGEAPNAADLVEAGRESQSDPYSIHRLAFEWLESHHGLRHDHLPFWWDPDTPLGVALLPIAEPEHALAHIHWWGSHSLGTPAAIALLGRWRHAFGAELMCHYGTVLQLDVPNRITSSRQAFDVACDLETACMQENPIESAAAIMGATHWHMHNRP
jgi:hypothetical protein